MSVIPILMSGLTVQGILVGSRDDFEAMNKAVAVAQLQPVVDRIFPFAEVPAAFALMQRGGHFGKIVIQLT
jgi:NADPH:quinone reductase-like Zn-dependent oxidoreductase